MKKSFKKLGILLVMLILTTGTTTVVQRVDVSAINTKSIKDNAKKAYKNYVRRYLPSSAGYPYGRHKLYDINRDGIPEMLFAYQAGVRSAYKIYTYKKGKILKMLDVTTGGSGLYRVKGKKYIVICTSGGVADNAFTCYKMQGKKLVKVSEYRSVSTGGGSLQPQEVKFYKNSKKISKAKYIAYQNKLTHIKGM